MSSICDYLSFDHKRFDELFTRVETNVVLKEWIKATEHFRLFDDALDRHIRMEESVLFPAFEKAFRGSGTPIAMLRLEHQRIKTVVGRIDEALRRFHTADFMLHTETYALLMQQHSLKEEDMLYPLLDRILADHNAEIISAMREKLESAVQ